MSELILKNGLVYTYIDEGFHAIKLRMADVHVKDGAVQDVAPGLHYDCETLDASGCLVLPGMVNMGASTFAARIAQGLVCDWARGKSRIAPLLDLAAAILTQEELKAVAVAGLWDTLAGGATVVIELCRAADGSDAGHPFFYRAAPTPIAEAVLAAGESFGVQVLSACGSEDGGIVVKADKAIGVQAEIVTDSAVACADLGKPYGGLAAIEKGAMMTIGTGATSSCMIEEMRATARAVKQHTGDPKRYRASDVFYSATVVGGRQLDKCAHGRIGPGFCGNLSVVSMGRFQPLSYPLAQYVYGASAADVRHVVCGGTVVKRDYRPAPKTQALLASAWETAGNAIAKLWDEARRSIL